MPAPPHVSPPKCGICDKRMIKVQGEGYDVPNVKSFRFVVGRYCKFCEKLYILPPFSNNVVLIKPEAMKEDG